MAVRSIQTPRSNGFFQKINKFVIHKKGRANPRLFLFSQHNTKPIMKKRTIIILMLPLIIFLGIYAYKYHQLAIDKMPVIHPTLYANLYQQNAAEYKALCYQAFNTASVQLNYELSIGGRTKPLAIVVDIDETVLDNSPYQAAAILGNFGYPTRWNEWIESASAEAVPGSVEFLNEAHAKGVAVFYVSNRKEEFLEATARNLKAKGFPGVENATLLLRKEGNEKESRRKQIQEKYEIVLLVGDNLGDFSGIFEVNNAAERMQQTESNKAVFGKKWIALPNAVYGNWVDVLPGYTNGLSVQALSDSLKKGLKGF